MTKMMWIVVFLTFVGGSLSNECYQRQNEECDRSLVPTDYPNTAEELMRDCKNLQTYGDCATAVWESCLEDKSPLNKFGPSFSYLKTVCQEDNPIFEALSSKLECIRPIIMEKAQTGSNSCTNSFSEENTKTLDSHMLPILNEVPETQIHHCLRSRLEFLCLTVTVKYHCGADASDALEDVLTHLIDRSLGVCTPEMLEAIQPVSEVFETVLFEELELKNNAVERK